jgi:hypothetical protein
MPRQRFRASGPPPSGTRLTRRPVAWFDPLTDLIPHARLRGRNHRFSAIAGCGSAGVLAGGSTNASSGIQFAQCMRATGVPNFPDGPIAPDSGINPLSPAYQSAQNACKKYLPRDGAGPPPTPASVVRQEVVLATCMRANGVPNFPDPNAQGNIQFPRDSSIPKSPAFQHAQNGPCKRVVDAIPGQ